uniref:CSON009154 protein n=1 Tax=Culicoides sonorensis TaxID=179676 RepID=A0A336LP45_CULSO
MKLRLIVIATILIIVTSCLLGNTNAQVPNAHLCEYTSTGWSPTIDCLERCMKNPKKRNSLAFCSLEKCFLRT